MRTCKGQQKRTRRVTWICAVALAALLLAGPPGRAEQTAGTLLQAGLYAEQVHGELDKAIELYQRILDEFPTDRRAAAKALLHIGLCKEKLGRQEALETYQNVVNQYPEQQNEVSVAKERIAEISKTLADTAEQPTFQKIEIASKPQNGILSPDGNQLAFVSDGALWTVPLHGKVDPDIAGEPVRLAEVPGIWDNGSLMAWSANGEWIAVNTWPDVEDVFVHVIPAAGGKSRVVRMPKRGSHSWSYRLSLSPDGQMLAFSALELRKPRQKTSDKGDRYIYTIPTAGGEPKQVSSGWGRMPSFSPDGEAIAYVDGVRREEKERVPLGGELWTVRSEGGTPVKLASVEGRLRGPVWSPDGKYIAAHHEPGGTNDSKEIWVFPLSPNASSAGEPEKIALPRSSWNMLAGWTPDNDLGVFISTEEQCAIYTVPASGGKAMQVTLTGWPYYPRWSPDGERIYFRGDDDEDALVSYVPAIGGNVGKVPLQMEQFNSTVPGGGHNISPDGKRMVMSASHDIWTIALDGGPLTRLTNDDSHEAYPCWSPDGEWVAFVDEADYAIHIVPAGGGEIRQVSSKSDRVGNGAITFSPDGKQIAFFSDGSIKTIPVEGGEPTVLVGKVKSGYHSQLAYSPDGSKIAHNAAGKIWITRLAGGDPEELQTGLPEGARLSEFAWSPDGEKIAFFAAIGGESEFWLVSNFLPEAAVARAEATTVRRIGDDWGTFASLSPDGRYLCDVDWKTETLAVLELATGQVRHVTSGSSDDPCYPLDSAISPDSTQVAYLWWDGNTGTSSLHVIGLDGSGHRLLHEGGYPMPRAWSPDGRKILTVIEEGKDSHKMVWISASDGSMQEIPIFGREGLGYPGKFDISPDGCFIAYDRPQTEGASKRDLFLWDLHEKCEIPLVSHPANDKLLGWTPDGNHVLFASDRAGSWDAWLLQVADGKRQGFPMLLKHSLGDVTPIGFTPAGSYYYAYGRMLNDVFTARLDLGTGKVLSEPVPVRQTGTTLCHDWSPDGQYLAYCERRPDESQVIHIRTLSTGQERTLTENLPYFRWLRWSLDGQSVLIEGAKSGDSQDVISRIDVQTGERSDLVRSETEVLVRPEMSPDGKTLYYGRGNPKSKSTRLMAKNLEIGLEKELIRIDPPAQLTGSALSSDGQRLVLSITPSQAGADGPVVKIISTAGRPPRELLHFEKSEKAGVLSVAWMPDSRDVLFCKHLGAGKEHELWRISAEGGEPRRLWSRKTIGHLRVHPDGQHIAFYDRSTPHGVWVLENFLPGAVARSSE